MIILEIKSRPHGLVHDLAPNVHELHLDPVGFHVEVRESMGWGIKLHQLTSLSNALLNTLLLLVIFSHWPATISTHNVICKYRTSKEFLFWSKNCAMLTHARLFIPPMLHIVVMACHINVDITSSHDGQYFFDKSFVGTVSTTWETRVVTEHNSPIRLVCSKNRSQEMAGFFCLFPIVMVNWCSVNWYKRDTCCLYQKGRIFFIGKPVFR